MNKTIIVLLLAAVFLVGCSQSLYMQGRKLSEQEQYQQAIDKYYAELKENPGNNKAWREIGVAHYKMGNYDKAEDALKQANNIEPDARTNLFLGLINEKRGNYDQALSAYAASLNMAGEGKTKNLIRAHLDRLIVAKFEKEAQTAIANEEQIKADTLPDNSIAVVDFDGSALPPNLVPISLGLAEFTAVDLSKVKSLNVVDRLKIDVLLNELKLSQSEFADPRYAPRVGKLIGSRKIVSGNLVESGENMIRLDGVIINSADSSATRTGTVEDNLDEFFKLQKKFVFDIIDTLDIQLTAEERNAIQEVPTESFLAFMAYSRGLDYQRRGMPDAARQSFERAGSIDRNFDAPDDKLGKISGLTGGEGGDEGETTTESFEETVVTTVEDQLTEAGLDATQVQTILYNGFIFDPSLFNRFGRDPNAPPFGIDIRTRSAVVIIRGDLDGQ